MAASSFSMLADFADTIHTDTMGAPEQARTFQETKKVQKSKGSGSVVSIAPVKDTLIPNKESVVFNNATTTVVEASLHDLFSLLQTDNGQLIKLMRNNNRTLNLLLNTVSDWYKYEQSNDLRSRLYKKDSNAALEEELGQTMAETKAAQERKRRKDQEDDLEQAMSDSDSGSIDVDSDGRRRRRKRTDTKRNRQLRNRKAGKFQTLIKGSWNKLKGLGKGLGRGIAESAPTVANGIAQVGLRAGNPLLKLASLAGAGLMGADVFQSLPSFTSPADYDLPESFKADPKPVANETQKAATAKEVTKASNKAVGKEVSALSKAKGLGTLAKDTLKKAKIGPLATVLTVADAAFNTYDVESDQTKTRQEKNQAHAGNAGVAIGTLGSTALGSTVGGVIGGVLGSIVPGAGTVAGAALGSTLGGMIAGTSAAMLGEDMFREAGQGLYDFFVQDKDEDKPLKIKMALDEVKLKVDESGTPSSILPQSIMPYGERNYGNPVQSAGYDAAGSYSGIPSGIGSTTTDLINPSGYEHVVGTGVLKDLKNSDSRETRLSNWNNLFEKAGAENGVDPRLIRAVTKQESGGKNNAVSPTGVKGLMQLTQATAGELGVTNREDPEQSINGGSKYLARLLKKHKGNVPLALASYNAGPGAVDMAIKKAGTTEPTAVLKALEQVSWTDKKGNVHRPDAKQAQDYVKNITGFYAGYKEQTGDAVPVQNEVGRGQAPAQSPDTVQGLKTQAESQSKAVDVVQNQEVSPQRTEIAKVPEMLAPVQAPTQVTKAPVPERQRQSPSPQSSRSGNQSKRATFDDMPMMIDEFGLTHLNLGGA